MVEEEGDIEEINMDHNGSSRKWWKIVPMEMDQIPIEIIITRKR